ncbi:aldehyde-activating protein [uncultured Shewanella sp.]|uniref:GFA family protein n=1 Tax=uncultured Shewanella sp. TaxID=173975 RepID=UPI002612648B|nr:aldehyde-activating protein [uncultured Shewanella sp.]
MSTNRLTASCHCGNVQVAVDTLPDTITSCNCSICRRTAALWGYYPQAQVSVTVTTEPLQTYRWGDEYIDFHRCGKCGCMTHYTCRPKAEMDRVGVNYRLFDNEVVQQLAVRRIDGASF